MTAFRLTLLLVPALAFAQTPPREVDEALRARVSEFCQYHVEGKFTKAWGLVAEESRDYYFNASKTKFESFKIDNIDYEDNFTRAHVHYTYDRIWEIRQQKNRITEATVEDWKIEDGKWVWFYDKEKKGRWVTPVGPSDPDAIAKAATRPGNGPITLPKDMSPEALTRAGQSLMRPGTVDKTEIVFLLDRTTSEHITLHNSAPGSVLVELEKGEPLRGLGLELDRTSIEAGKDAVLTVVYKPYDRDPKPMHTVRLILQPFNQVFEIHLMFGEQPKAD